MYSTRKFFLRNLNTRVNSHSTSRAFASSPAFLARQANQFTGIFAKLLYDPPANASLLKHLFSPFTVQFERGRHHFLVSCCNLTKALGRQIPVLDFAT